MATPPRAPEQANKVVVAFMDGRRLKGYVYDFSALKDSFNVLPADKPLQEHGIKVLLSDLKADGKVSCRGKGPGARWRYLGK